MVVWYCVQARQRAAEKWKDEDETTRELLLCAVSTMLKVECCDSATHTMDEIDLAGFWMYKSLAGLDCTLPGFVLHNLINIFFTQCTPNKGYKPVTLYVGLNEGLYIFTSLPVSDPVRRISG